MSHNITSNQSDYQSAITPTRPRTLLILMTDKCWPSQSAVDKLPLIFTPSIFYLSRHHLTAGMMDSSQIRGRMYVFLKTCSLLCSSPLLSVLVAISQKQDSGFCSISDLSVGAGPQQSGNTSHAYFNGTQVKQGN